MSAHQGFRVAATTTGVSPSPFEHLRKNYVYGGGKRDEPFSAPPSESTAERKRRKMARLAGLEAIDPPLPVAETCRRLEVSPKTLRSYRAELQRNREAGPS